VPLAFGVIIYFALKAEPSQIWLWVTTCVGVSGLLLGWGARRIGFGRVGLVLTAVALCAAGFALAQSRAQHVAAPVLYEKTTPVHLSGTIVEIDPATGRGLRLTLDDVRIRDWDAAATPKRVRVSLKSGDTAIPGARISLTAILLPPPGAQLTGSYDYARTAWFEQIGATGFAITSPQPDVDTRASWQTELVRIRAAIARRIQTVVPGQGGAILAALSVGHTQAISVDEAEAWRASGLYHIISISGLHMAIVCGGVFFAVRFLLALVPPLALRYPIKSWAAVVALLSGCVYLLLSGAEPPAERSFVMVAVSLLAILLHRRAISQRALAVAAAVIIVCTPEVVMGASFQMSYIATVALVALYEQVSARPRTPSDHPVWRVVYIVVGIAAVDILTSVVAGLATAPFAAQHFNRGTRYGLLANMLAAPITTFWVMPGLGLAGVAAPFGGGKAILTITGHGIALISSVAHGVAALPGATFWLPSAPAWALVATAFGLCWVSLWRGPLRWLGVIAALTCPVVAQFTPRDVAWVSADVKTALVAGPGHAYAYRKRSNRFTAESWLRKQGLPETLDAAVPFNCDSLGCISPDGAVIRISITDDPTAAREDCANVDLVVLNGPIPEDLHCAARLIDGWRVMELGGIRVRRIDGNVRILPAYDTAVARLWTHT
jgi:competence protein ComEC